MNWPTDQELQVPRLGPCAHPSPLIPRGQRFIDDHERALAVSTTLQLDQSLRDRSAPPRDEVISEISTCQADSRKQEKPDTSAGHKA